MPDRRIVVRQVRSGVGSPAPVRRTLVALGLRGPQRTAIHRDTPQIRGMVAKVRHLIEVRPLEEEA